MKWIVQVLSSKGKQISVISRSEFATKREAIKNLPTKGSIFKVGRTYSYYKAD